MQDGDRGNRFERDTAVERIGNGRYLGTVDPGWAVIDGAAPNGGYLLALAARAMRDPLPHHPDPVTLTGHFLRPPDPGPVAIDVEVVRIGRRHATVAAQLRQGDRECVRLLGTFGDLSAATGPTRIDRPRLALPAIEDCIDVTTRGREQAAAGRYPAPPILVRFDHRWPEELARWSARLGWVPTIELTVQIRGRPAAGYLAARFTTEAITTGYLEEDGEVWDAEGSLVVLSRQLALAAR